ncbi:unnamed protein product [Scytosiphon promiscuus]
MAKVGRGGDADGEGYTPYSSGRMHSMGSSDAFDVEDANQRIAPPKGPVRVVRRINYFTQTIVLVFILTTSSLFVWKMVALSLDDGYWGRMVNVGFLPAIIIFMLFIVHFGITQIVCALGPVAHMQTNSQFFSAIAPARALTYPDITIQMPVYKEGLEAVILPSIVSLEAAISHYRKAGGFAKIFINDDGLQTLSEKEREARISVYRNHKIAYVARPPHGVKFRKGLFKKASNMNYCLDVSNSTTELMEEQGVTDPALALSMVQEAAQGEFLAGGDLTMGSIILLVDSDTRVPEDCLTKVVGEFQECPNLGFVQCRTTPLRAEDNYWEDMIAHFTENIYDIGIALSVSGGDPAPLVGHNAFLRWEAMKKVSWREDGMTKFWSEAHVSEDFDMSLRLQTQGFIGRYATYTGPGFQEGVSLSCVDEVIRLRKYAYGACEMLLNKFKDWPCKGPITSLFWSYLGAPCIPWPSKLQMAGYLGTYLAMAYSVVGICSYIVLRMFYGVLQEDITNTYDVFITVVFVFGVIGIFGAGTIRYRMGFAGDVTIFQAYWIELRNAPAMTMFWSHILWHITTACWCYFWNLDIVWGATAKESTRSTFWVEFKDTLKRYKGMYISLTLLLGVFAFGMIYTDQEWTDQRLSFPLTFYVATHLLGPFLLNPVLTRGYY